MDFKKKGPQLWALLGYAANFSENDAEEFYESLRKNFYKLRGKKLEALDERQWTRNFIAEWQKRTRFSNDPVLLLGLLRFSWELGEIAEYTGKTDSYIKMRLFELLGGTHLDSRVPAQTSRDCARFDLHAIENLVERSWPDPLLLFGLKQLKDHLAVCERCRQVRDTLASSAHDLQQIHLRKLPDHFLDEVRLEKESTRTSAIRHWISLWPWYFKVPSQLVLISAVIYLVLAVPYAGDMLPSRFPTLRITERASDFFKRSEVVEPTVATNPNSNEPMPPQNLLEAVAPKDSPLLAKATIDHKAAVEPKPTPPLNAPAPTSPKVETPTAPVIATDTTPSKGEKIVYHWEAFTDDVEGDSQKILEVLTRFEAQKAGNLALGAPYRTGRYYHFSVTKEQFDSVFKEVSALNLDRLKSERAPSPKITPAGRNRVVFILSPKKSSLKKKDSTSSEPADEVLPSAPATPATGTNS